MNKVLRRIFGPKKVFVVVVVVGNSGSSSSSNSSMSSSSSIRSLKFSYLSTKMHAVTFQKTKTLVIRTMLQVSFGTQERQKRCEVLRPHKTYYTLLAQHKDYGKAINYKQ